MGASFPSLSLSKNANAFKIRTTDQRQTSWYSLSFSAGNGSAISRSFCFVLFCLKPQPHTLSNLSKQKGEMAAPAWLDVMKQTGLDDMILLSKVTNEQIRDNLRERFESGVIYVSTPACVALLHAPRE
jgi:hypothetical protein